MVLTNNELINGLKQSNEDTYRSFFELHYRPLVAFLLTYTRRMDQAEEVAQEAFIRIWEKRNSLTEVRSVKALLYTIAKNIYIDQYRKTKVYNRNIEAIIESNWDQSNDSDEGETQIMITKIHEAISSLPARCQQILIMNKLQGFTYSEIAEELNISVKTVDAQIQIAYKKLRESHTLEEFFLFLHLTGNHSFEELVLN